MRRYFALLPLLLLGGCYAYQGPPPTTAYYTPPPVAYEAPPPPPRYAPPPVYAPGPADPSNCGTPYAPAACPPLPRVPLPYYPANR